MRKFLQNRRLIGTTSIIVVLLIVVGIFGFRTAASAGIFNFFVDPLAKGTALVLGGFIAMLVQLIGGLVVNLMYMVLAIAQYNQFLASTAVSYGWVVVRDVVNMGFVIVLLAIAIGTILQQQQYNYSQTLPKFLAAAILVNFSKTICGLFIDAAQIVMMTFVGAFSQAGGGNFAVLIGLNRLLSLTVFGSSDVHVDGIAALSGLTLALIFVSLALIVIGVMVAILVIRIIALWFLIILSPAAFFLMSLPSDRGYASKWWDQFINYLLVGPVMAFFLWLSFTIVSVAQGTINDSNNIYIATELGVHFEDRKWLATQIDETATSGLSTLGGMAGYILGIGLLMGSLMAAQQLSSVGGSIAGGALSGFKDYMAGKRGPFNPIRTAREVGSGLAGRWEKRRKERVERLTDRVQGVIGTGATLARGAGQAATRRLMETRGGEAIRATYRRVEQGLDRGIQTMTFGQLGFGRDFRNRIEEDKTRNLTQATTSHQNAGRLRGGAQRVEENLHSMELERDRLTQEAQQNRRDATQVGVAGTPAAAQLLADADEMETRATAINNTIPALQTNIDALRAQADGEDRQGQAAEFRGLWATMRRGFAGFVGSSLRTAAIGWAGAGAAGFGSFAGTGAASAAAGGLPGYLAASAVVGPFGLNRLGQFGDVQKVEANEAQAGAVDAVANKHKGKTNDKLIRMLEGVDPGYNQTPEEQMGLIKALLENDYYRPDEIPEVRRRLEGLGARGGVMDSVEGIIETKYPGQTMLPMDRNRQRQMLRRGSFKPEDATIETISSPGFLADMIDPSVDVIGEWLKKAPANIRQAILDGLTPPQFQELLRSGKVRPEDVRADQVDDNLLDNLMNPTVQKMGDWIKNAQPPARTEMINRLEARLNAAFASPGGADVGARNAATGQFEFNPDFIRNLRHFTHAGGNTNRLLNVNQDGTEVAGAFRGIDGDVIEGLWGDAASSSALAGFSTGTLRNRTGAVMSRSNNLSLGALAKVLQSAADKFVDKNAAATNVTAIAEEVLARSRVPGAAFGTAASPVDAADVTNVSLRALGIS